MVLDEDELVVQPSAPASMVVQDPVMKNQRIKEAVKRVGLSFIPLISNYSNHLSLI
jgi:hypothetical protein